eukprot:scaffold356864_cov19-Prasinocladus_malaysianus.AAC.1
MNRNDLCHIDSNRIGHLHRHIRAGPTVCPVVSLLAKACERLTDRDFVIPQRMKFWETRTCGRSTTRGWRCS